MVFQIGGRWFLWSVVGSFLGKWSVVPGRWSVSLWSVAGRWAAVLYYALFLYSVLHFDSKYCASHLSLSLNRFVQTHLLTTAINS